MNSRFKTLLYEPMYPEGTKLLEEKSDLVYADSWEEENLMRQVHDVDAIIIRAHGSVTKTLMNSASRLKVIGRHGVGLENIDLMAAKERGIEVVYTPAANAESVAEHFVALALILAKKLKVSRSRLLAIAAREFIQRHNNIELLKLLNDAYEDVPESEPMVNMMRSNHYKMVKDQW